jgi:hypothetical protein
VCRAGIEALLAAAPDEPTFAARLGDGAGAGKRRVMHALEIDG